MRLVIARCSVDYAGRLSAHLPLATRLLMVKGDGSLLVHSDGGSYKPLNWMSPPCTLQSLEPDDDQREAGIVELWQVTHTKTADRLIVSIHEVLHDWERTSPFLASLDLPARVRLVPEGTPVAALGAALVGEN